MPQASKLSPRSHQLSSYWTAWTAIATPSVIKGVSRDKPGAVRANQRWSALRKEGEKKQNEGEQNGALVSLLNFPPLAKVLAGLSSRALQGTLKQGSETEGNEWGTRPDLPQISQAQFANMKEEPYGWFVVFFFYSGKTRESAGFCVSVNTLLKQRKTEKEREIKTPILEPSANAAAYIHALMHMDSIVQEL